MSDFEHVIDWAESGPRHLRSAAPTVAVGPTVAPEEREADRVAADVARRLSVPPSDADGDTRINRALLDVAEQPMPASKISRSSAAVVRRKGGRISGRDAAMARQIAKAEEARVRSTLCAYLLRGMGGGGAHWWRSKEVRKFRQALKDAARDQAYADFDVAVGGLDGDEKDASRDLKELVGSNIVYDDAKASVDASLREFVAELEAELESREMFVALHDHALREARRAFSEAEGNRGFAERMVRSAIAGREKALTKRMQQAKDEIVGKRDEDGERTGDDWALTAGGAEVRDDVVDDVKKNDVGGKSLEKALEADSMSRGMIMVGDLIDAIITSPGETLQLSIELRIPVATGVVFIAKLEGTAARGTNGAVTAGVTVLGDPNRVEVAMKLSLGAGAEAVGMSADATAGVFVRAGSDKGSRAALQALSYGAYRLVVPAAFKDLWAPPDKRGKAQPKKARSAAERAETWAAAVEQGYFGEGDGAFAHVGLAADGAVGVNAGFAEFGIGFGDATFAKYDRETLTESGNLGDRFGQSLGDTPDEREQTAAERRKHAAAGVGFSAYLSLAAKIGAGDHVFEVSGSGSGSDPKNWGVDITVGVGSPADAAVPGVADRIVNDLLECIAQVAQKIKSGEGTDQSRSNVFGKLGTVPADGAAFIDHATQRGLSDAIAGIHTEPVEQSGTGFELGADTTDEAGEAITTTEDLVGLSKKLEFALTFGMNGGEWVTRVELRSTRGISIGNSVTIAKFEGSKTTRLFAAGTDGDGGVFEVLGVQ